MADALDVKNNEEKTMKKLHRIVGALFVSTLLFNNGLAEDALPPAEAVKVAVAELVNAFETGDGEGIQDLMTEDHLAISPNYGRAYSVSEQIDTLPDLDYDVTSITNETLTVLDNNAVLITAQFRVEGSFQGEPLPGHIFVSQIWVVQDGRWKQKLYQETAIDP